MGVDVKTIGVDIPSPLVSKGKYPVAYSSDILGAMQIVDNEAAMLAIAPWKRTVGMECYVIGSKTKYRLVNNPDTDLTVLADWEKVDVAIDPEILETLMTKEEWEEAYNELIAHIDDTYVSLAYLEANYLSARQMMDEFVTKEEIAGYATVEQLNNIARMLSRVMVNVIPATIVRVEKGTTEDELVLPTTMTITFSDGTYYMAPVVWNTSFYDGTLVGYQYIEGTMLIPPFVINKGDITNIDKCHIVINVYDNGDTPIVPDKSDISGFEPIANIGVTAGTPFAEITLPNSVVAEVLDSTGTITYNNVPVTWDTEGAPEVVYGAMTLRGTVDTGEELTNLIGLEPKLNIIIQGTYGDPKYEYRTVMYLPAGETELSGGYIKSLTNDLLYGVANMLKQRRVDLRFLGFVDANGNDMVPEFSQVYPTGIRVPVYNSIDSDVANYINAIKVVSEMVGYSIEFDVPGGAVNPRITLDDETHRIIFNAPSLYKAKFLLSKSETYNLPYPDIC